MIVATAGHVDHGKTLLVKTLTGVDTDRLPDEKRRGLTIDLGFAYLPDEAAGTIGFIDVPGHERFVHNMLCGVAGIDAALFVVAADDGPMPQTVEHLAILDLLDVRHGLVALTKIDRVSAERVATVRGEIERLLARTTLANAPIYPISAITGEGIEQLGARLRSIAKQLPRRATDGNFRLAIDRAFTVAGAGLVVTGTVFSGELASGDPVRVLSVGTAGRARTIHAQNATAPRGRAGERCALNLAGTGLKHDEIRRGDWIVNGPVPEPSARIDARIRVLASEAQALRHWTPVHVHLGASSITGRVATLEAKEIAPGTAGLVQLVLERPIGAVHGDHLILRDQSARRTVGGGRVIDVFPPVRGRAKPERLDALRVMESADPAQALAALLDRAVKGLDLARFAACRNLSDSESKQLFESVPMKRVESATQRLGFTSAQWERLRAVALESVAAWHRRAPDSVGPPEDRILDGKGLPRGVVIAIASELVREGTLARSGSEVRLPTHRSDFAPADADVWMRIVKLLEAEDARPPTLAEVAERLGAATKTVQSVLDRAVRRGLAVRVSQTRFFLPETVARLAGIAETISKANDQGRITAAAFRDASGLGRNLAIEMLEFFDRVRYTRRVGDARIVLKPAAETFSGGGAPPR